MGDYPPANYPPVVVFDLPDVAVVSYTTSAS